MTLLSTQLMRLRQDTASVLDVDKRKRASILFLPEEAAKVSYEVVLQLAQSGVETLKEIDTSIMAFSTILFGQATLKLERGLLSTEENDKLSANIRKCLVILSPHMLLRAAQKCFEWLLCRFYILEMQAEDVLLSILPYHDTNIFTKISCQVKLPPNWRWLKSFKKEPPHRNIVLRELRSNPTVLSNFMAMFEDAVEDEKNPIVGFCIAATNIIVSNGPKSAILSVIVQSCIKGLQSDTVAFRAYAISALTNLCLQRTSESVQLDDALVRRLLKIALRDQSPLNNEALECMAVVYFSATSDLKLPSKFTTRVIDLLGRGLVTIAPSKYNLKLTNQMLNFAVEAAVTVGEMTDETSDIALSAVLYILRLNIKCIDLTEAFNSAINAATTKVGTTILKEMRKQHPDVMTPKLSSCLSTLDAAKLPAEITIHHTDVKVRHNALEQINQEGNQDLIKSLLERETDTDLIRLATEKLDIDLNNISLMCEVAKNQSDANSVIGYLLQTLEEPSIERYQRVRVLCHILNSGKMEYITKAITLLGVQCITELSDNDFNDVVDTLCQTGLNMGLVFVTKQVVAITNDEKRFKLSERLFQLNMKDIIIPVLIECRLPLHLTDQIAFSAFSDMALMRQFIINHLPKNLELEISKKVTIGRYFARLAFRHDWCLDGVISLINGMNCTEVCPVVELVALVGMTSKSPTARKTAVSIFGKICESNSEVDAISLRILKRSREILSDENQLGQILTRALKKEGVENWKLIHGKLSVVSLTKLLQLCPPIAADHVAPCFLQMATSESDQTFFVAIFQLLNHCQKELTKDAIEKIQQFLSKNSLGPKAISELVHALTNKNVSKDDESLFQLTLKEMIVYAMNTTKGPEVGGAVQTFIEKSPVSVVKYLLQLNKQSSKRRSVIEAKRQKMSEEEINLSYYLFILDRLSARGFEDIAHEINELLEVSLQTEGSLQDTIQQRIVGIAAKTKCRKIRPEVLVEVLRRCSVRGSDDSSTHSGTNQLLISALSLLSSLATSEPSKVLQSLMSVFTFMGAGLLARADDRYSFHSIQETIKCVVPPLLKSKQQTNPLQDILDVFCTALPHVPMHRQVAVFESLIVTCGSDEAFWRTWLQLSAKHIRNIKAEDESIHDGSPYSDLMSSLIARFSVQQIIRASSLIVTFLTQLPFDKIEDDSISCELRGGMDSKSIRNLHYFITFFVNRLFSSHDFLRGQLAQITDEEEVAIVQLYRDLLQGCFSYTEVIQSFIISDSANEKYFKALNGKVNGIIEKIIGLLPSTEFAQCITGLIQNSLRNDSDWLTTQSLDILCTRLRRHDDFDSDYLLAKSVLDQLEAVLKSQKSVQSINLAAKAIKLLSKTIAKKRPTEFRKILSTLPDVLKGEACANVKSKDSAFGSVILCAAVLISELKMAALGDLNWAIEAIMDGLERANRSDSIITILTASLGKILIEMIGFISPHLPRLLTVLCSFNLEEVSNEVHGRLMVCINALASLSSRILLPQIAAVYVTMHDSSIITLLLITEQHIDKLDRGVAVKQQAILQNLFLKALEFRTDHVNTKGVTRDMIVNVENATCKALVRLALKLPEASLRPLLFKIFAWATVEDGPMTRLLSLYTLYGFLAAALKSMFPIFTGSLAAHLIQLLPTIGNEKTTRIDSQEDKRDLLVGILKVLQPIFLYDNGEFLDETTTTELVPLLINLLGQTDLNDFENFCDEYLIVTIAQAAAAISDDAIWRPLNYRVLLKTRDENPIVRIAALKCIDAIVDKLGDDYQSLLQESAPQFLAELLEDDDERVEKKMTETVAKLEAVFGESLQSYF